MHGLALRVHCGFSGCINHNLGAKDGWLPRNSLTSIAWFSAGVLVCGASAWISSVSDVSSLLLIGTTVNVALSIVKMCLAQFATHKKALMADAVHGLGDSATELLTAIAHSEASRPPDREHPWGHGKIESLGAVVVTSILLYVAASMAWDSFLSCQTILRSFRGVEPTCKEYEVTAAQDTTRVLGHPKVPAADCNKQKAACGFGHRSCPAQKAVVAVALGSILLKEALFRATLTTANMAGSKLVKQQRGTIEVILLPLEWPSFRRWVHRLASLISTRSVVV